MNSLFDRWGLSPQERRLVVGVGIAVFVVLNFWLIIPKFGEFGRLQKEILRIQTQQLDKYKAEIAKKPLYETQIRDLLKAGESDIASEDAALRIFDEVNAQAALAGVQLNNISQNRTSGKTNVFFEEASVGCDYVNTGEKELIAFLYHLADRDLLIRAKSMTVQPDLGSRTRLQGRLTLVKSYQRKAPPKAAPTTAKPATASARPTNAPARPAATPAKPLPVPSGVSTNKPKK